MAAAITFFAGGSGYPLEITSSGLGFFGDGGFGSSVQVGQYQDTTFITNGAGTINGGASTNTKYLGNATGVSIDDGPSTALSGVPLVSGALNVRFTFDDPVLTQNGELRIFDRLDEDSNASGVTTQVAQLVNGGSGVDPSGGFAQGSNSGWYSLNGSGSTLTLLNSPGSGGVHVSGSSDTRHDWFFTISATPTSIGSKTSYGLFVQLEFL